MAAQPLAQEYVEVARVPSPDLRTDDCALARLPDGDLLASFTFLGRGGCPRHCFNLARSGDGGRSWERLPALDLCDGLPFVHDGRLYLLANRRGELTTDSSGRETHGGPTKARDIVITRSDDGGRSWLEPVTLFEGSFWNTPTGYAVVNGCMYRAFDIPDAGADGDAVGGSNAVVAGDLSGDPLDPAAWRISSPVNYPGIPGSLTRGLYPDSFGRWLEPNVVCVRGSLRVLSRVRIDGLSTANMCAVCDVDDDGETLSHRFVQFYPMPGGQCKFHVIRDEVSDLFWAPVNIPSNSQDMEWGERVKARGFHQGPGNERRFLMLVYSLDALNWFQAGCIAMSTDPLQSFHYAAPLIDGDDLLILSRTSRDAPNQHDSELVTFHRVEGFRHLALNLHPDT